MPPERWFRSRARLHSLSRSCLQRAASSHGCSLSLRLWPLRLRSPSIACPSNAGMACVQRKVASIRRGFCAGRARRRRAASAHPLRIPRGSDACPTRGMRRGAAWGVWGRTLRKTRGTRGAARRGRGASRRKREGRAGRGSGACRARDEGCRWARIGGARGARDEGCTGRCSEGARGASRRDERERGALRGERRGAPRKGRGREGASHGGEECGVRGVRFGGGRIAQRMRAYGVRCAGGEGARGARDEGAGHPAGNEGVRGAPYRGRGCAWRAA